MSRFSRFDASQGISLVNATLIISAALIASRFIGIVQSVLFTTGSDGTQSLNIMGILFALLKLVLTVGVGSLLYLCVSRLIRTLGSKELGSVHRLLNRLHLSWI